jgi:uncharacterized protein (TIGR02757 family)
MVEREFLEELYGRHNRRACAERDPVSFLYPWPDVREREVVALLAALLAYGRLEQIMASVADAFGRLAPSPRRFLLSHTPQELRRACRGFTHRVVNADRLWRLIWSVKQVLERHGSLEACFAAHDDEGAPTILPGLTGLAGEMLERGCAPAHLVADPAKGSACKRWNLFLRWMVRRDEVDPGGWTCAGPSRLIVPLDAHMWRICRRLGLTTRRTCNMAAALEVTAAFRRFAPQDPVRYDFALMHASVAGEL